MASVQTAPYDGRVLRLTVVEESYSIQNNTSTLRWTFESVGGGAGMSYSIYNWGVWVNGQCIYPQQTTKYQSFTFPATVGSTTGTITVGHNADGSAPDVGFTLKGSIFNSADLSFNGSLPLTRIPRQANVTGATDFTDETNPTITFNNAGGFRINARLEFNGQTIQRDNIPNTGSYTFNLTEAERQKLRNATTNSPRMTVREVIATCIGGTTENYWSWADRTMTIVNANPVFTNNQLSYEDTDQSVVAITEDNSKIVRNRSNLLVSFTGATALKGATITSYQMKFNGATDTNTQPFTKDYGIVNVAENQKVQVIAIDSRGLTTTIEKTITIIDWVNPSAIISIGRVNNYEDSTNIKTKTTISSVDRKNAIESIIYRYKKTSDATFSADVSIDDNTQYTFTIDKNFAWDVQIVITDKFGITTYNLVVPKGKPIFFIDINKLAVGINCFPTNEKSLALNGQDVLEYDVVDTW